MTYKKAVKPKSANDNRHDQSNWDYLHTWLYFWLDRQNIPLEQWHFNRAMHYTYELYNRPWIPERSRIRELNQWLWYEALAKGFSVRNLTHADLPG